MLDALYTHPELKDWFADLPEEEQRFAVPFWAGWSSVNFLTYGDLEETDEFSGNDIAVNAVEMFEAFLKYQFTHAENGQDALSQAFKKVHGNDTLEMLFAQHMNGVEDPLSVPREAVADWFKCFCYGWTRPYVALEADVTDKLAVREQIISIGSDARLADLRRLTLHQLRAEINGDAEEYTILNGFKQAFEAYMAE